MSRASEPMSDHTSEFVLSICEKYQQEDSKINLTMFKLAQHHSSLHSATQNLCYTSRTLKFHSYLALVNIQLEVLLFLAATLNFGFLGALHNVENS